MTLEEAVHSACTQPVSDDLVDRFIDHVKADVTHLIPNWETVKERIYARASRVSFGPIYRSRMAVTEAVTAVLKNAIPLAPPEPIIPTPQI